MLTAPLTITGCILARNEARRIEAAIQSLLRWTEQVIVLDNESEDGTADIARRYTEHVRTVPLSDGPSFDGLRNRAIDLATGDWIFYLDADERVPERLGQALRQLLQERGGEFEALIIPFRHYFCGAWVRHSFGWPGYTRPQLLKKGCFRYGERLHSGVEVQGMKRKHGTAILQGFRHYIQNACTKVDGAGSKNANLRGNVGVGSVPPRSWKGLT